MTYDIVKLSRITGIDFNILADYSGDVLETYWEVLEDEQDEQEE